MGKDKLIKALLTAVYGFLLYIITGVILIVAFDLDLDIIKYKILHVLIFTIIWISTNQIFKIIKK